MQGYQRPNATARCNNLKGSAVNVDLSCSAFDPGDTLPDYSGSVPSFSRRLRGDAVGIRVFRGGMGSIGLRGVDNQGVVIFTPGANVFPLADTTLSGDTIDRKVNPSSNRDVNRPGSPWRSPASWRSIDHSQSISTPAYFRFQNEYLGTTWPNTTIANVTGNILLENTDSTQVPKCEQAEDSTLFPTKTSGRLAGARSGVQPLEQWFKIDPNPASGKATLSSHLESAGRLSIIDPASGRVVGNNQVPQGTATINLDLQGLAAGLYILQLTPSTGLPLYQKLVIFK